MSKFAAKAQNKPRGLMWIFYGVGGVGKTETMLKLFGVKETYLVNLELRAGHVYDTDGNSPVGVGREDLDDEGNLLLPDLASMYKLVDWLAEQTYKAVAWDSLTVLYKYIFAHVNNRKFDYAAEGGWDAKNKAAEEAQRFAIYMQNKLQSKGIHVLFSAHDKKDLYNDPKEEKPYDRWTIDSPHTPVVDAFIRLADNVGFCHYEVEKVADAGKNKIKVNGDGTRMILFENRPWAPNCKNTGLPALVTMDKEANGIRAAMTAVQSNKGKTPAQLLEDIKAILARAPKKIAEDKVILLRVAKAEGNLAELTSLKTTLMTAVGI